MSKTCSICLESVSRPAKLMLNCECKYYVHYKCYYNWWKNNKTCIICHTTSSKPITYRNRNKTPTRRHTLIRRINNRRRRTYPPDTRYIHDYMSRIPFDNENELKTIFFAFMIGFIGWILLRNLNSIPSLVIKW